MEHGFGKVFGVSIVGEATYEKSVEGWLYQTAFVDNDLGNKAYHEVTTKAYRSSAGAAGHTRRATMEKGTMRIDSWLVAEQSATMFPADPENARSIRKASQFLPQRWKLISFTLMRNVNASIKAANVTTTLSRRRWSKSKNVSKHRKGFGLKLVGSIR
jgi:hypothetical protein